MSHSEITVAALLSEVRAAFAGGFDLPLDVLLSAYNALCRKLCLLRPGSDAEVVLTAENGKIETELSPLAICRVFHRGQEMLRASAALLTLLRAPLYAPTEGGILVCEDGEYRIVYRPLPDEVTAETAEEVVLPFDPCDLPLLRADLLRCGYLYIGDTDAAAFCEAQYEKLLAEYKARYGVCV